MEHGLTVKRDEFDFYVAICDCGWQSWPCPDPDTAGDCYGDHRADMGDDLEPA